MDGITIETVSAHLLQLTASANTDQVFTLHAELEGMKLSPVLDQLLAGWKAQGYKLVAIRDIYATLNLSKLPRHEVKFAEIPGRSGNLMVQGPEFLV